MKIKEVLLFLFSSLLIANNLFAVLVTNETNYTISCAIGSDAEFIFVAHIWETILPGNTRNIQETGTSQPYVASINVHQAGETIPTSFTGELTPTSELRFVIQNNRYQLLHRPNIDADWKIFREKAPALD